MKCLGLSSKEILQSGADFRASSYIESDLERVKRILQGKHPGKTIRVSRKSANLFIVKVTQTLIVDLDGTQTVQGT
jgi:hypothetical protein